MTEARPFPFVTPDPSQPPAEYGELRADHPLIPVVLPTGHHGWVAVSYAAVRQVCTDERFSKNAVTRPDAPKLLPIARGSKSIVTMDPPEHTRMRRLIGRAFTARRVEELRPRVREIAVGLIEAMERTDPPADAVEALAMPLPMTVICELLGVPVDDQAEFRGWSDGFLTVSATAEGAERARAAAHALTGYLRGLIERKRAAPADDLLTGLIDAYEDGNRLDEEELLAFGVTLLVAGYHTTASAISHSLFHLLAHAERYGKLQADPAALASTCAELLRYSQVGGGFGSMRIAVADVTVCGTTVREGEPVIPAFGAANRDPDAFAHPDVLDLDRPAQANLAFGAGTHYCLGAQLARTELETLLELLIDRLPGLKLAVPAEQIEWNTSAAFTRPVRLPIEW